ncbi:MAG TPA: hypothetical protein VF244_03720, partial [Acidimicrobiales bacterium]
MVDPVFDALIAVSVDVRAAGGGMMAALRTTFAGRTDYVVTVKIRNLTTESLPGMSVSGSAGRSRRAQDVSFEIPPPATLAPGQTSEQEVRVTLPAPVFRAFTWQVIVSGAGSPVSAEAETHTLPLGFIVLVSVLVGAVVAILCRRARRRNRRRRVARPALVVVTLATVLLGPSPAPPAEASPIAEAVLVIDGRGDGHGVGMSQDGALAMGQAGAGTGEILAKFYPGTDLGSAGGIVGVRVLETDAVSVDVSFPEGGEVRAHPVGPQPDGFPLVVLPGGTATVSVADGRFRAVSDDREQTEAALGGFRLVVDDSETTTTTSLPEDPTTTTTSEVPSTPSPTSTEAPPEPPTAPTEPLEAVSAAGLWLVPPEGATTVVEVTGRRYRGLVEVGASGRGGLELVDHL